MTTVFCLAGSFGFPQQVDQMLGGSITAGNTVVNLDYANDTISQPGAVNGGEVVNQALIGSSGQVIVLAHSLGAVACCWWLCNKGPTSSVPPANVQFILLGNSVRPYGGFCYYINWFQNVTVPTNTPYQVIDFARQYDGWADWPPGAPGPGANPLEAVNIAAIGNAQAGMNLVHPHYEDVLLTDDTVVSYQVGNITYMWDTTWPAPALGVNLGTPELSVPPPQNIITAVEDEAIRPAIEAGYHRPVTPILPTYAPYLPAKPKGNFTGAGTVKGSIGMVCSVRDDLRLGYAPIFPDDDDLMVQWG